MPDAVKMRRKDGPSSTMRGLDGRLALKELEHSDLRSTKYTSRGEKEVKVTEEGAV